jgi:gamma-glutamyltranspeptidase/glutathione hydrolase
MQREISRRTMLGKTGQAVIVGGLAPSFRGFCQVVRESPAGRWPYGAVVGENTGMRVGEKVLAEGGNAVDAAVAAMLAACVAAPARSGIGGYGGFMVIASAGGRKVTAIDFNTVAPATARAEMFPLDERGEAKGRRNFYGWEAVGVPGVLAGLQLALDRHGTRSFRELVQPAIRIAEEGIVINKVFANTIQNGAPQFAKDAASAKLYLRDGKPLGEGDVLRNPDLAAMLTTLAKRNSVDSFYRGDIGQRIADECQKNGGLLTAKDLEAYHAREVKPLTLGWKGATIFTAPLTAAGLTCLEAISILKALAWEPRGQPGPAAHARLEALRLAWKDRLELFGDPEKVKVPIRKLLSNDYAHELAAKASRAVQERKALTIAVSPYRAGGTTNICSVDRHGNVVAVTATHGNGFGAQVTVDGLGLTLGHGMSRFDLNPRHPNAVGSGKRPMINVTPSVVLKGGRAVLGMGAGGGERIPNCMFDLLTQYVATGASMEAAVAAPRVQCTGTTYVAIEPGFPDATADYLKEVGFNVQTWENSAIVSAVSFDPRSGECRGSIRGPVALGLEL